MIDRHAPLGLRRRSPIPLSDWRWYRITHWCAAIGALGACVYFFATFRGWIPGDSGPLSSLLLLGSSTAAIWSLLIFRRFGVVAVILQSLSVLLLVASIASLSRGD
ncbi:MAG: hypothetical protein WD801_13825 [Gemmatimonadaceae bacterium]